ncbi:hypothetical protein MTO96_024847 [Rhipicephalus appendiculatus]
MNSKTCQDELLSAKCPSREFVEQGASTTARRRAHFGKTPQPALTALVSARAHRLRRSARRGCALDADHRLLGGVPARRGGANRWSGVPPRRRTAAGALRSPFPAVSRKTLDKSSSPFSRTPRELSRDRRRESPSREIQRARVVSSSSRGAALALQVRRRERGLYRVLPVGGAPF